MTRLLRRLVTDNADFARFLGHSTGSVNEVLAGFDIALDDGVITEQDFKEVEHAAEHVVRQLGGFARNLRLQLRAKRVTSAHRARV